MKFDFRFAGRLIYKSGDTLVDHDGASAGITVTPFAVQGDPPRFARRDLPGHTVGLIVHDTSTGGRMAFVPGCGGLTPALLDRLFDHYGVDAEAHEDGADSQGIGGWAGIGMAAGLQGNTEGLGAVGAYKSLSAYTQLGGVLTVFALPDAPKAAEAPAAPATEVKKVAELTQTQ